MAYTRHTWECGEAITDTRLNNMEAGIEEALNGGAIVIKAASLDGVDTDMIVTTDKTWQEIADALENGTPCYVGFMLSLCGKTSADELNIPLMMPVLVAGSGEDYIVSFLSPMGGPTMEVLRTLDGTATGYLSYSTSCEVN